MKPAAITASLCDWKNVKTRSVVQLILEIPVEQALAAFQTLGIPQPAKEIPVAVALLKSASPEAGAGPARAYEAEDQKANGPISAGEHGVQNRGTASLPPAPSEVMAGGALDMRSASPEAGTGHGTAQTAGSAPVTTPSEAVAGGAPKQRKPMTRAQVAGMLCRDKQFQDWMLKRWGFSEWGEDERHELAAHWVRDECAVETRADLDRLPRAQVKWDSLHLAYLRDTNQMAEERA